MIKLKKQRVIRFIPILQLVTVFFWIGYIQKNNVGYREFLKHAIMMLAFMFLISAPRIILHIVLKNDWLDTFVFYISIYPTFLGISTIAVMAQDEKKNNSN